MTHFHNHSVLWHHAPLAWTHFIKKGRKCKFTLYQAECCFSVMLYLPSLKKNHYKIIIICVLIHATGKWQSLDLKPKFFLCWLHVCVKGTLCRLVFCNNIPLILGERQRILTTISDMGHQIPPSSLAHSEKIWGLSKF